MDQSQIWCTGNENDSSGYEVQLEEDIDLEKQIYNPGNIRDLIEDNKGSLWIFSQSGLYVKRPDNSILLVASSDFPEMSSLTSDREGNIWGVSTDKRCTG